MKLCHICRHIPFENPPSLPKSYIDSLPGLPENDSLFYVEYRDRHNPHPRTFGYHHYQSQDDLKQSAQNCNLCHLIFHEFRRIVKHASRPIADYRFYITKRENHQDGFVVWTYGERGNIWRVGGYGYCVKNGADPLSSLFIGRQIDQNAFSIDAKDVAKHWIHHCVKSHPLCGPPQGSNTPLPTRIIDLGTSDSSTIKLLETHGTMKGYYTNLSYTWGPKPHPYETTKGNLSAYKTAITFPEKAPQTILDAIQVTRMAGIRYLWVDALCIVQDDTDDWAAESSKMLDYYGNTYFTITAAASTSAYNGIFHPRDAPDSTDFPYTSESGVQGNLTVYALNPYKENIQPNYLIFEGEPITTRGWTLQERVLSSRNILYASDQMYYECNTHFLSEDGFHVQGRQSSINPSTHQLSLFGTRKQDLREMWDLMVQNYGSRTLFNPDQDKFIAFSGLAQKFGTLFHGDEYIAGLWKKNLVESLFWTTDDDPDRQRPPWDSNWPPATYRAPSWSWACIDATIFNPDGRIYGSEKYVTYANHKVVRKNDAHPYGQITDARLMLNAPPLIHLQVKSHTEDSAEVFDWSRWGDSNEKIVSLSFTTGFDYCLPPAQLQEHDIHALVLARDTMNSKDNIHGVYYLCLLVTPVSGHSYRRLGRVFLDEKSLGNHATQYSDRTDWVDIQLV